MLLQTNTFRALIGIMLTSVLMSCGFHLRGHTDIPMQAMPVFLYTDDGYHDLRRNLQALLKQNDVSITANKSVAATTIKVNKMNLSKRVVSVDSLGRAREYLLTTVVDFTIAHQGVGAIKSIQVSRDVDYDANNILAYDKEEATTIKDMNADIARLIMLQLQASVKTTEFK